MNETENPTGLRDTPTTEFLLQFLQARERGASLDLDAFCKRAGHLEPTLRREIAVYENLSRLGVLFGEEHPGPEHAGEQAGESVEATVVAGRYELHEPLGSPPSLSVLRAWDRSLERTVAIKLPRFPLSCGVPLPVALQREARAMARLDHRGIVRVLDVSLEDPPFLVMEYLPGPSLAEVIEVLRGEGDGSPDRAQPSPQARRIARSLQTFSARVACLEKIAAALAYGHDRGVLHRDVKPANVVFDADGNPCLVDLGIAHLSGEGAGCILTDRLVGTHGYIAPEQIREGRTGADPGSDQFVLGILCYELLTLEHPFRRASFDETLTAIRTGEAPPMRQFQSSIERDLERVVLHSLEKEPDDRYPSVAALRADLQAVLENRPVSVERPSWVRILFLALRRHRLPLLASVAVLAIVLGALSLYAGEQAGALIGEVDSLRATAAPSPQDHSEKGAALRVVLSRTEVFEASWLSGLTWRDPHALAWDAVREWIDETHADYGRFVKRWEAWGASPSDEPWVALFRLQEIFFSDHGDPHDLAQRGRVLYPPIVYERPSQLYVQVPLGTVPAEEGLPGWLMGFNAWQPIELLEEPKPGVYRLLVWDDAWTQVLRETEFFTGVPFSEGIELSLRSVEEARMAGAIRVPQEWVSQRHPAGSLDGTSGEPEVVGELLLPAYDIGPLVTRAQFRRFLEATGTAVPEDYREGPGDDRPAFAPWPEAQRYAQWAGARLPSAAEVVWADRLAAEGAIEGFASIRGDVGCIGEWVGDLGFLDGLDRCQFLDYELLRETPWGAPIQWLSSAPREQSQIWQPEDCERDLGPDNPYISQGFRLARSADSPEAMAQALAPRLAPPLEPR